MLTHVPTNSAPYSVQLYTNIKVVYRALMGREYDQDGLNFWLNTLSQGEHEWKLSDIS